MSSQKDTICAPATGQGGAIHIVRLSGSNAISIADGIFFGIISYVLLKVLTGKAKDVSLLTGILGIVFLLNFILN